MTCTYKLLDDVELIVRKKENPPLSKEIELGCMCVYFYYDSSKQEVWQSYINLVVYLSGSAAVVFF